MSLVEPVWWMLKGKLRFLYPELIEMCRSEEDWRYFRRCIRTAWDALDQGAIDSLIRSMPNILLALRKACGYYIRY